MSFRKNSINAVKNSSRRLFSTANAGGISVKALDDGRPVTELSLIVKAGSRYQQEPGAAHLLEQFAFKDTTARSALRLVRETELLGGQLSTKLTREDIVLTAKFLREDLPYFVQALSDVASGSYYYPFELAELVGPVAALESDKAYSSPSYTALEAAHAVAFRRGLGNSLLVDNSVSVTAEDIHRYGHAAYTKSNIRIAAKGVTPGDLTDLVGEKFGNLSDGIALTSDATTSYSGESRIRSAGDSALVIAFPTVPSAGLTALSYVLGGRSSTKWNLGNSLLSVASGTTGASIKAHLNNYSDASLLSLVVTGPNEEIISKGAKAAVSALKTAAESVSSKQATAASAQASFADITARETDLFYAASVEEASKKTVSADTIKKTAVDLVKGKSVVSVVGAVHKLPYADELL